MIRPIRFVLPVCLLILSACSADPAATSGVSDVNSKKLNASDLQGSPMQLNPSYKGDCAYAYKGGAKSSACTATLDASQVGDQISLVLSATVDNQQAQVTTGNYRIVGNRIEDDKGNSSGSIGTGGLEMEVNNTTSLSIRQMTDGTLGVLVTQLPNLTGDQTNGYAFTASLK